MKDKSKNYSLKKNKAKKVPEKCKPPTPEEVQKWNFCTIDGTMMHYNADNKSLRATTPPPQNTTPSANTGSVPNIGNFGNLNPNPPMDLDSSGTPKNTQKNVTVAQLRTKQRQL